MPSFTPVNGVNFPRTARHFPSPLALIVRWVVVLSRPCRCAVGQSPSLDSTTTQREIGQYEGRGKIR